MTYNSQATISASPRHFSMRTPTIRTLTQCLGLLWGRCLGGYERRRRTIPAGVLASRSRPLTQQGCYEPRGSCGSCYRPGQPGRLASLSADHRSLNLRSSIGSVLRIMVGHRPWRDGRADVSNVERAQHVAWECADPQNAPRVHDR